MATLEEQQKTVDTIKHGLRTYNIYVSGYGGEMVLSKCTKEQYEFWSEYEDDHEREFLDYMLEECRHDDDLEEDNIEGQPWEHVPESARFENGMSWYEFDDVEHTNGATYSGAYITVESTDSAGNIEEVFDGSVEDFESKFKIQKSEFDYDKQMNELVDKDGHNYIFFGMSVEKGQFSNFEFESMTPPEWDRLKFDVIEYPNGDNIIENFRFVDAKGEDSTDIDVWDQGGDGTTGKGMYAEVWDY